MATAPATSPTAAVMAPPLDPAPPKAADTLGTDAGPQEGGVADVNDVPQHIEVNVRYITTAQGTLTCLETLGAVAVMVLYLLMAQSITYQWYARVAFLFAFTYGLNNVLIIISGVASPCTQLHLPETLFYSLYHCMAGLMYVIGGAIFHNVHKHDGLALRIPTGVVLTGVGVIHCFHSLVNFIK
ncbi:uncharacterized protein LOC119451965 isoform X1 [Dermacentor silvarum]|uniref:uncharacterized protein LOC119451965 isoform X1 n=1 Tax=Dermacentor silvarum TaxID=543639 RepID=UPI00210085F4|nr:uncharacterized protein LOC119451965 isoform X1 [Dermacentor silvarum]